MTYELGAILGAAFALVAAAVAFGMLLAKQEATSRSVNNFGARIGDLAERVAVVETMVGVPRPRRNTILPEGGGE